MHHDLPLIATIAIGFCAAFVCGLVAAKLRLSPIVGYLIAGIIIGPSTPGVTANMHIAEQLSELGILLLMFGVGLHFSIKDLMEVRRIALPGAIVQIAAATAMGVMLTYCWGWSIESGIMLGLALSVASTVVLLRALEEHNLLRSTDGNIAIGWLIVEDIFMVLALVLIPALAVNNLASDENAGFPVAELLFAAGKVVVFVIIMLVVGKRLFPWLLMVVARTRSRELFTLCVFAVALGVAFGAAHFFGISLALGAFFAGMMIRESDLSREAADKALPLQDAFAVLFFVSVGMLFDPDILFTSPLRVLAVVAIIIVGKSIAAGAIVLLFRYPLRTALLVSAGLAQIGEFSFILAALGVHYGLLPKEGQDLILAAALITISLNPVTFWGSKLVFSLMGKYPRTAKMFKILDDDLSQLKPSEKRNLKDHVILVGHGRVGKYITHNVQQEESVKLLVIDSNRDRISSLRADGFLAIAGDANYPRTLKNAALHRASAILVAVPNPFEARRIVEAAREVKPNIKVLVRAHNDEEMEYFNAQQVSLAVMGPREVARRMLSYLLTGKK